MAEQIEIKIATNADTVAPQVMGLRQEVKALKKELDKLPEGSEEYNKVFTELAQKMHEVSDQQYLLKNSAGDLGTIFSNMQTVTSQVVAGFGALTAVESMLGVSTDDTQKAMLKMQQTMALVQGLKGLEGMGKSVKGLVASFKAASVGAKGFKLSMNGIKAAIASTGIGVLVIALGELIAHWDAISSAILGTNKNLKTIEATFEADTAAIKKHSSELDFDVQMMEAAGASAIDCAKQRVVNAEAIVEETKALIKKNEAQILELQNSSTWYNHHKKEIKLLREQNDKLMEELEDSTTALTKAQQSLTLVTIRENKKRSDAAKTAADNAKKAAETAAAREADIILKLQEANEKIIKGSYTDTEDFLKHWRSLYNKIGNDITTVPDKTHAIRSILMRDAADAFDEIAKGFRDKMSETLAGNASIVDLIQKVDPFGKFATVSIDSFTRNYDKMMAVANDSQKKLLETVKKSVDELERGIQDTMAAIPNGFTDVLDDIGAISTEIKSVGDPLLDEMADLSDRFKDNASALDELYQKGILGSWTYFDNLLQVNKRYVEEAASIREKYISKAREFWSIDDETFEAIKNGNEDVIAEHQAFFDRYTTITRAAMRGDLAYFKDMNASVVAIIDNNIKSIDEGLAEQLLKIERSFASVPDYSNGLKTYAESMNRYLWDSALTPIAKIQGTFNAMIAANEAEIAEIEQNISAFSVGTDEYVALEELKTQKMNENAALRIQMAKEEADQIKSYVSSSMNATADFLGSLASVYEQKAKKIEAINGEETEESKRMLKVSRGLQISQVIIQTLTGVATAIATGMQLGPIAGPIVGAINSAAVLASGIASIQGIKNDSLSTAEGAGSAGSSVSPNIITQLSPDAYETRLSDQTAIDLNAATQATKVYVTTTDINKNSDAVKAAVTTSTF